MINIKRDIAFTPSFIKNYVADISLFLDSSSHSFSFFNHSFSKEEILSEDMLLHIAFDPFRIPEIDNKINCFFRDYYELSQFLLHGKVYFKLIKKIIKNKNLPNYNNQLKKQREMIIDSFSKNKILKRIGINDPDIIRSEGNYFKIYNKVKTEFENNNKEIKEVFDYKKLLEFNDEIRGNILRSINLDICPYCNRQYIDTYTYEGKIKAIAQIDHLYPKSMFPLYSLSLINFVPSCSHCNCIIKKDRIFPWREIYNDNNNVDKYFEIKYTTHGGLFGDTNGFLIKTSPRNHTEELNSIFFRHDIIYKNHIIDAAALIKKKFIFSTGYRHSIEDLLSKKLSDEEYNFMIYGVTGSDEDFMKIPLSKLKNDILKS